MKVWTLEMWGWCGGCGRPSPPGGLPPGAGARPSRDGGVDVGNVGLVWRVWMPVAAYALSS
eukprot:356986-Chlamydomonas_euryale.AAC.1